VTNRKIGSPATNLVLKELKKESAHVQDISNYKTHASNGVMLKSSTVFLRDEENYVIGALCINYDINYLLSLNGLLQNLLSFDTRENKSENFSTSINDVINEMIEQVSQYFNKPPVSLKLEEKIEFTKQLDKKGFFLIKGSAEYISTVFGVSKFTVYNYLQKAHTQTQYFDNQEVD